MPRRHRLDPLRRQRQPVEEGGAAPPLALACRRRRGHSRQGSPPHSAGAPRPWPRSAAFFSAVVALASRRAAARAARPIAAISAAMSAALRQGFLGIRRGSWTVAFSGKYRRAGRVWHDPAGCATGRRWRARLAQLAWRLDFARRPRQEPASPEHRIPMNRPIRRRRPGQARPQEHPARHRPDAARGLPVLAERYARQMAGGNATRRRRSSSSGASRRSRARRRSRALGLRHRCSSVERPRLQILRAFLARRETGLLLRGGRATCRSPMP